MRQSYYFILLFAFMLQVYGGAYYTPCPCSQYTELGCDTRTDCLWQDSECTALPEEECNEYLTPASCVGPKCYWVASAVQPGCVEYSRIIPCSSISPSTGQSCYTWYCNPQYLNGSTCTPPLSSCSSQLVADQCSNFWEANSNSPFSFYPCYWSTSETIPQCKTLTSCSNINNESDCGGQSLFGLLCYWNQKSQSCGTVDCTSHSTAANCANDVACAWGSTCADKVCATYTNEKACDGVENLQFCFWNGSSCDTCTYSGILFTLSTTLVMLLFLVD